MNHRHVCMLGVAFASSLCAANVFAADEPKPSTNEAVLHALAGAPRRNAYAFSIQGGWPFSSVRAQIGLTDRLAFVSEVESVLLLRNRPMAGIGLRWYESSRIRITGEALVGWLFQRSEEIRRGPNGELRIRIAVPLGRWVPYAVLGTRHALLPDLTTIQRASGTDTNWSFRHEWTPWATLGLGFGITRSFGLDIGINAGWVGAPDTIALPGFHVGLHFGGDR